MECLLALIIGLLISRMFFGVFDPLPPEKKEEEPRCESCKTVVQKGEKKCHYCEMIEFRKWKLDGKCA
jgi:hypothetical protein